VYKVGILNNKGDTYSKDFKTRDEADTYILEEAEKGIKKVIITNAIYPNDREIINF
jgi:hypothetical protein